MSQNLSSDIPIIFEANMQGDLVEFLGDNPIRTNFIKKRAKALERLAAIDAKAKPLRDDVSMYDKMIAAIDERDATAVVEGEHAEIQD